MKISILSHSSGIVGPIDFIESELLALGHTLNKLEISLSTENRFVRSFLDQKLISEEKVSENTLKSYTCDVFRGIKFLKSSNPEFVICANNLMTLSTIIYKKIFNRRLKVCYFGSDFAFKRFKNVFLNKVYSQIERFCCKNADIVCSNSRRSLYARIKCGAKKERSILTPNCCADVSVPQNKEIYFNKAIYVGHIDASHGLLDLVKSKHFNFTSLTIFGPGSARNNIASECKNSGISLIDCGFGAHKKALELLINFNGVGLATYAFGDWMHFASPLKIKEYIACGIPCITTKATELGIKTSKIGLSIIANKKMLLSEQLKFFDIKKFKKIAPLYSKNFTWVKNAKRILKYANA